MVMASDVVSDAESRMKKAVAALQRDLGTVRTGRAHPALVEGLQVDYHGVSMPLNQLASISIPEAQMIVIQPWDKQAIQQIEKAFAQSDLGLTPNSDGRVIRVTLPALTEERRKDLAKRVRKMTEDGRIAVRNVRRDAIEKLRTMEKQKELSQDESRRAQDEVQRLTDSFVAQMDRLLHDKEAEVMET